MSIRAAMDYPSPYFVLHYDRTSRVERSLHKIVSRLEVMRDALVAALDPATLPEQPMHVFLAATPEGAAEAETANLYGAGSVYAVFLGESSLDDVERGVIARLIGGGWGDEAARSAVVIRGLTGFCRQRALKRDAAEEDPALAALLRQGAPVRLGEALEEPASPAGSKADRMVVSFVSGLLREHGAEKLREFAVRAGSEAIAAALEATYGRPLPVLEQQWLGQLRQARRPAQGTGEFLKATAGYLRPHWLPCLLVLLAISPSIAFYTIQPLLFRAIIDDAILPRDMHRLGGLMVFLSTLVLLRLLGEVAKEYFAARVGAAVMNGLRLRVFDYLQLLSLDFYGRMQAGDLMFRYTNDLTAIDNFIARELPNGIARTITLVACGAMLFTVDWRLALGSVLAVLLLSLSPKFLGPKADQASFQLQEESAEVASTVQENIGAQALIKAFDLRDLAVRQFHTQIKRAALTSVRFGLLGGLLSATVGVGGTSISVLAIGVGAYLVIRGDLTVGTLFSFTELLWYVAESLQGFSSLFRPLQQASGANIRIQEILDEPLRVCDAPDAKPLPLFSQEIRFEDVVFSYTGSDVNLNRLSLAIPRGSSVAFVGPSGCGKSTALSLIARLYDPTSGSVTYDGIDISTVTQESLRGQIGVVFQDNFLFNISIRENIRLGRPEATDGEVVEAAQAAEIHDFVMRLPQGYDTPAGERGGRLSGGQRQRIGIARALLRHPRILLLDEATSALDAATEAAINATLERVAVGRTSIAVTHRLSTVQHLDRIFVLDRGRLAEAGRHDELVALNGTYASLWRKQVGMVLSEDGSQARIEPTKLASIPILSGLEVALLAQIAPLFVTENIPENRTVIQQGDPGDRFYIIVRGKVEVLLSPPSGGPRRVAILQDGDFFGEIALLRNTPRNATVRTVSPSTFLTLTRGQFADLLDRVPHLREAVEAVMVTRS